MSGLALSTNKNPQRNDRLATLAGKLAVVNGFSGLVHSGLQAGLATSEPL